MAQRSPSGLLSSVSFMLIGVILGSLLSHGIHYFTISCVSYAEGGLKEFTVRETGQLAGENGLAETEKEEYDLEEVECDRIRTRLRGLRQLVGKGAAQLPPPADPSRPSSRDSLEEYLHPTNPLGKTDVVETGTISVKDEYRSRKMLLVGVITAQDYLATRAVAVYGTWGVEVDKILFYVGDDCVVPKYLSMLPTITLPGVPDRVYPPQRKVFMMLKHMHDHYIDEFDWFMRADDDVYVRGKKLLDLVDKLNPAEEIYLGRPGAGKAEDIKRLKLLPHEQYCMGGPGVIFSNAALRSLVPHFQECLEAIEYYNKFAKSPWYDEDAELGRCVSRKIGIQCSASQEVRSWRVPAWWGSRCVSGRVSIVRKKVYVCCLWEGVPMPMWWLGRVP